MLKRRLVSLGFGLALMGLAHAEAVVASPTANAETPSANATSVAPPVNATNPDSQNTSSKPVKRKYKVFKGSWKGTNVQAGYVANTGNTDSKNINATSNVVYALKRWTYSEMTTYQRQETSSGGVTANKLYTQGRAQYALSDKNYIYGQGSYTNNQFDGYDYVFNENIGYGRYLSMPKNMSFNIFLGPGLQQTQLVQASGGTFVNDPAMQVGSGYSWTINPSTTYNATIQTQSSAQNIHTDFNTGLTVLLTDHLSFNANYDVTDDTKPVPGKAAVNTTTTMQLGYNF